MTNFGTFKTRLLLNAGNLQSTHPYAGYSGNYVNDAVRLFIMRAGAKYPNLNLFPEHRDVEWTDITIADQAYLALPNDQIIPQRAWSLDSSTSPNLNNSSWRLLGFIEPEGFDQLTKPTTNIAYPTQWTVREGRVYFNPTPRTTKTTYVKIDGVEDEPDMSSASDTPRTNVRWHPAILDFASYLLCTDLGYDEDAKRFLAACDDKIATAGGAMVDLRRAALKKTIQIKGAPRFAG